MKEKHIFTWGNMPFLEGLFVRLWKVLKEEVIVKVLQGESGKIIYIFFV